MYIEGCRCEDEIAGPSGRRPRDRVFNAGRSISRVSDEHARTLSVTPEGGVVLRFAQLQAERDA